MQQNLDVARTRKTDFLGFQSHFLFSERFEKIEKQGKLNIFYINSR